MAISGNLMRYPKHHCWAPSGDTRAWQINVRLLKFTARKLPDRDRPQLGRSLRASRRPLLALKAAIREATAGR